MLKIFVCEDNHLQRSEILKVLKNIILIEAYDMEIAIETHDPHEIIAYLGNHSQTGLYFLDINLEVDINGIELAREIRKRDPRGFIVFITNHPNMSAASFRYRIEAMDFIPKSELIGGAERIIQCMSDAIDKYSNTNNVQQKVFTVKKGGRMFNLSFEEIIYIETTEKKHRLRVHSMNRMLEFYGKIKVVAEELDERFLLIHRSNIVNKDHILETSISRGQVVMSNGAVCYMSKRGSKMYRTLL